MKATSREERDSGESIVREIPRCGSDSPIGAWDRSAPRCWARLVSAAFIVLLSFVENVASAMQYEIQAEQSRIRFEVAHVEYVKPVRGRFGRLTGEIGYDAKTPEAMTGEVVIDATSVDTDNGFRDEHLRTSFFEADRFPEIRFRLERLRLEEGQAEGALTMHGVTREVVLSVSNLREIEGPSGLRILRARASTRLNRREFGVEENTARSEGLGRIMDHIQQGLDELIDDEVVVRISIVAHAVAKPGSPAALASAN